MRTIVVVALYCRMYCNAGKIVPSSSIHIQHHNTARGTMGLEDLRLKGPVGVGEGATGGERREKTTQTMLKRQYTGTGEKNSAT